MIPLSLQFSQGHTCLLFPLVTKWSIMFLSMVKLARLSLLSVYRVARLGDLIDICRENKWHLLPSKVTNYFGFFSGYNYSTSPARCKKMNLTQHPAYPVPGWTRLKYGDFMANSSLQLRPRTIRHCQWYLLAIKNAYSGCDSFCKNSRKLAVHKVVWRIIISGRCSSDRLICQMYFWQQIYWLFCKRLVYRL